MKKIINTFILFLMAQSLCAQDTKYNSLITDGIVLLQQNRIPDAIEKYKQARKLIPSRIEANYGIGVCYATICIQNGAYGDSAIYYLLKVNKIEPGYRSTYNNIGMCYIKLEKYSEALQYFDKAIKQNSKNAEYYFYSGFIKQKLGKKNEGCKDLNTASKLGFTKANELIQQYCR